MCNCNVCICLCLCICVSVYIISMFFQFCYYCFEEISPYFAFVTRHPLTSQYSSSGVIESLNALYLDLKST